MTKRIICIALLCMIGLTACSPKTETTQAVDENRPVITTNMGDFEIVSVRFASDMNGYAPANNQSLLIVELARPGEKNLNPDGFSAEEFQTMLQNTEDGKVHILGDVSTEIPFAVSGWISPNNDEFAIGFLVPSSVTSFQLIWPGNDPIPLTPAEYISY